MNDEIMRFACTQCGRCCNRSPEVQLSEAAPLADVFVFRLMFRLYTLPRTLRDYVADETNAASAPEVFYQKKRLLTSYAARKHSTKVRWGGRVVDGVSYLMISALTVDRGAGACSALNDKLCSIYERRPWACRSVPFHYSRAEALALSDLQAFLQTSGYCCESGAGAPVVLQGGRIVDPAIQDARAEALAIARRDQRWAEAIVRRVKTSSGSSLPSLKQIENNAALGAMGTSMGVAWQIAADAGLIGADECRALIAKQTALIDRELAASCCAQEARQTLADMRAEYRQLLGGGL